MMAVRSNGLPCDPDFADVDFCHVLGQVKGQICVLSEPLRRSMGQKAVIVYAVYPNLNGLFPASFDQSIR